MGLNVLVVDDSATMRSMVGRTVRMTGLAVSEIHEAANGQEALDILEREWIDVVLADINMPVMDGLEMIDHVRRKPEWADMPIIVISTESSQTRIEQINRKGVGFIHKPFTPEAVRDILLRVVGDVEMETSENAGEF